MSLYKSLCAIPNETTITNIAPYNAAREYHPWFDASTLSVHTCIWDQSVYSVIIRMQLHVSSLSHTFHALVKKLCGPRASILTVSSIEYTTEQSKQHINVVDMRRIKLKHAHSSHVMYIFIE